MLFSVLVSIYDNKIWINSRNEKTRQIKHPSIQKTENWTVKEKVLCTITPFLSQVLWTEWCNHENYIIFEIIQWKTYISWTTGDSLRNSLLRKSTHSSPSSIKNYHPISLHELLVFLINSSHLETVEMLTLSWISVPTFWNWHNCSFWYPCWQPSTNITMFLIGITTYIINSWLKKQLKLIHYFLRIQDIIKLLE